MRYDSLHINKKMSRPYLLTGASALPPLRFHLRDMIVSCIYLIFDFDGSRTKASFLSQIRQGLCWINYMPPRVKKLYVVYYLN